MPASLFSGTLSQCDLEKLSKVKCPVSVNENERIFALRQSELLDSDADDPMFDRFASLAKRLFNVPIALVTLVDIDRQWFKANIGLEGVTETHRDVAFCSCKLIRHSESCLSIIIMHSLHLEDFLSTYAINIFRLYSNIRYLIIILKRSNTVSIYTVEVND